MLQPPALSRVRSAASLACALMLAPASALASDESSQRLPLDRTYVEECGSCHVAYPPSLLPQTAWRRLMATLNKHFGTDASLDAASSRAVLDYLTQQAGSKPSTATSEPPRITHTDWFKREHRKVAEALWRNPAVKSPSNCGACHARADSGSYRSREIQVPRSKDLP